MIICERLNLGGKNILGKWIYGDLVRTKKLTFICVPKSNTGTTNYNIEDTETIGQFTGLYDKNKVPIYEGDIVKYFENESAYIHYDEDRMAWGIKPIDKEVYFDSPYLSDNTNIEVIGNIYDNPDLLGE